MLLQKTNSDWWSVRVASGSEGYVPANYVKEVEPRVIQRVVKRPVKVKEKVKVKKIVMEKEIRQKPKTKAQSSRLRRQPSS